MSRVRIVSNGTAQTTQVLVDGMPLKNVTAIEIEPITMISGLITVHLTLINIDLDLIADPSSEENHGG